MTIEVGDTVRYVGKDHRVTSPWMEGAVGRVVSFAGEGLDAIVNVDWGDFTGGPNNVVTRGVYLTNVEKVVSNSPRAMETALSLVYGDRGAAYGHPKHDYDRTAQIWDALLRNKLKDGEQVTAKDAILMMIGVKMSRLVNTPDHVDSIVDIGGYAECYDRVRKYEAGETDS